MSETIHVRVNGKEYSPRQSTSLLAFLGEQGVDTARIAVERNGDVVPRREHPSVIMKDGDVYEVVHFVGGG